MGYKNTYYVLHRLYRNNYYSVRKSDGFFSFFFIVFVLMSKSLGNYLNYTSVNVSPSDARSCVTCDKVLEELEKIDDDTDTFGVDFVKINDKRLAKQYGITKFPALTYFREEKPIIYEGGYPTCKIFSFKSQKFYTLAVLCGFTHVSPIYSDKNQPTYNMLFRE